jgi:hypothetical protein
MGINFNFKVGPIHVDKTINKPTKEMFNNWVRVIREEVWFDKFKYLITGSFPNILNDTKDTKTWDVDIVLIDNGQNEYEVIRDVLIECSRVALEDLGFYLDIYYQNEKDMSKDNTFFYHDNVDSVKPYMFKKTGLSYAKNVIRDGKVVSGWNIGEEVFPGLWVTTLQFPSEKQVKKLKSGFKYENEIYLRDYMNRKIRKPININFNIY